jgi:HD-GYP domain-containing protein (c-di-GMP phosphodiesterase class II)
MAKDQNAKSNKKSYDETAKGKNVIDLEVKSNAKAKASTKSTEKTYNGQLYGTPVDPYIEEAREYVARSGSQELFIGKTTDHSKSKKNDNTEEANLLEDVKRRETALKQVEANLNKREVEVLEREIKCYSMQEEIDRLRPLSGLFRVVKAMATEPRLDQLLEIITRETKTMLRCDRCSVFVLDPSLGELWAKVAQGMEDQKVIHVPLSGTSIVGLTARTGQIINIPNAYSDPRFDPEVDNFTGYATRSILCVPMLNRNREVIGVFEVLNKANGPFTHEDQEWLQALSTVASGLIEQARSYAEIESFVDKTLETLAQTIDKRDPLTAGHSVRVTNYSLLLGDALNLGRNDMDILHYAAMMHDYGKIGVPEAILWKNGRLTPEEYAIVQTHAKLTYDLLSNLPFTRRLASVPFIASCHHEKLDGSGYYRGLKGHEIPFLARVISVSDVFDALTSVRHYRNRMAISKVIEIMEAGRDNHFDSDIIDAFYELPCDRVLKVMESERGQSVPVELDLFKDITVTRLVELVNGSKARPHEEELKQLFESIYNAGLPSDYQALD